MLEVIFELVASQQFLFLFLLTRPVNVLIYDTRDAVLILGLHLEYYNESKSFLI